MSAPIGEVRVEVRGDTSKVDPDIERGLRKAAADADDDLNRIGKDFGKSIGVSMEKELEHHGPELSRSIEKGVAKSPAKLDWELNEDGNLISREVRKLARGIEREVASIAGGGGGKNPFSAISTAIADAIGAGFNISGKSPLIFALIPLFGFIAELVLGVVQAVNALSAALFAVPGLIAAIVFQVGVLFVAFQGVGTAIQGAFQAKNAEELKQALQGLMPAAQEFVKSLLPLKEFFANLRAIVQEGFFIGFGNSITAVLKTLGPVLIDYLGPLATALGGLARTFVTFFADPAFRYFVALIIPATVKWLDDFSVALDKFLFGVTQIGIYLTPFLSWIGESLNSTLATLGDWLNKISSDPGFNQWLENMKTTFNDIGKVIDAVAAFVFSLVRALDRAGGNKILEDIADQLNAVAAFLSTEFGTKALEGLIHLVQVLAYGFVFIVLGVLAVLGAFEYLLEWLRHTAWPWITNFFSNTIPEFFEDVGGAIMGFFETVGKFVIDLFKGIGQGLLDLGGAIISGLFDIGAKIIFTIIDWGKSIWEFFTVTIPDKIKEAVGSFGDLLYDAGRSLIDGLIRGIKSMFGPLGDIMSEAARIAKEHWPFSPAKEGPLSGKGDPLYAGQHFVDRLVAGMEMEQPTLAAASNSLASTFVFGPNSVQATFNGQLPTNSQAMALGGALGGGIAGQLAARDARLAVRAMA